MLGSFPDSFPLDEGRVQLKFHYNQRRGTERSCLHHLRIFVCMVVGVGVVF